MKHYTRIVPISIGLSAFSLSVVTESTLPTPSAIAVALPTTGLSITLDYQSGRSNPPSWDPGGLKLTATVEQAKAIWERIFRYVPSKNVTVNYRWEDIDDSLLAVTRIGLSNSILFDPVRDGGREIDWFYDPDPDENSEFAMQQRIARSDGSASGWYDGSVPGWFELEYSGAAQDAAATTGTDLLTVALHEMAHLIGLRSNDDYSVPSAYLAHKVCPLGALKIRQGACGTDGHVRTPSLMRSGIGTGVRHLPTANDVLALAHDEGWTTLGDLDLPQKEMLPACDGAYDIYLEWNTAQSWFGHRVPDQYSNAYVREGGPVGYAYLTANAKCLNLHQSSQRILLTGGFGLQIGETLEVLDSDTLLDVQHGSAVMIRDLLMSGSTVIVRDGASLAASADGWLGGSDTELALAGIGTLGGTAWAQFPSGKLALEQGATVTMSHAWLVADVLELETAGRVRGFGDVRGVRELHNGGYLEAQNSWLVFTPASASSSFDLDGEVVPTSGTPGTFGEIGELQAIQGSIRFTGGVIEPFDGILTIGENQAVAFDAIPFDLGADGVIHFQDYGPTTEAWLSTGISELLGVVDVDGGTLANLSSGAIGIEPGGAWTIDGRLALRAPTRYHGTSNGALAGAGTLVQVGDVEVVGGTLGAPTSTVVDVDLFDWDGKSLAAGVPSGHDTVVMPFARFEIAKEVFGQYSGRLVVSPASEIQLDEAWQLGATGTATLQAFPHAAALPLMLGDSFTNHGNVVVAGYLGMTGGLAVIGGEDTDVAMASLRCCRVENHGTIRVQDGSVLIVTGDLENHGTIDATAGVVVVLGYVTGGGTVSGVVLDRASAPWLPACS